VLQNIFYNVVAVSFFPLGSFCPLYKQSELVAISI